MKKYFNMLLNGDGDNTTSNDCRVDEDHNNQYPLTWLEVETALKSMRNGKSPGFDDLSSDMIKAAGIPGLNWLYRVLSVIWEENKIPEDWSKGVIIPLFKKGNRRKCGNYRGITLLSHTMKLLEKIIEMRIRKIVEPLLEEEQHGFRKGRSTVDLIFAVRMLTEKYWEYGKNLVIAFVDIEKAYDSVPRNKIWECLEDLNVPKYLIDKVKMLYQKCYSCVQIGNGRSEWFETKRGVQQGSALSPLLFVIVMDKVIKSIKKTDSETNALVFADDVLLWGETEAEVQKKLNKWNDTFKNFGLKMSKTKTVEMTINREGTSSNIFLEGTKLESVSHFKYVGSTISKDNTVKQEILNRTQKASNFYNQVRSLLWDCKIPQKAKTIMYHTYFVPILTYGLEACTLLNKDFSRIQATEMRFIRTMNQTTRKDKIRNEVNRKVAGIEVPITSIIKKRRLQWYGHIMRMNRERPARKYFDLNLPGRRPRGRPRKRWIETVRSDVEERGLKWEDVLEQKMYEDRRRWRGLVHHTRETGVGK